MLYACCTDNALLVTPPRISMLAAPNAATAGLVFIYMIMCLLAEKPDFGGFLCSGTQ